MQAIWHVYDSLDLEEMGPTLARRLSAWARERSVGNGELRVVYLSGENAEPDNGGLPPDVADWFRERLPGVVKIYIWVRW